MPKKTPKPEPKPDLVYEIEGAPPKLFVLRDGDGWLTPDGALTTTKLTHAGTFSEEKARELAKDSYVVEPLEGAVRERMMGANPLVLQALAAALGSR